MAGHDIIVIGASMGGVDALSQLVAQFPADLSATVCIVQHATATGGGYLARILGRAGRLPATTAQDGERFEPGHIYVAPPDYHLLVTQGYLRLTRSLRENRVRPAIDPLFRSAAVAYRGQVIGIVLSGMQHDGTAGLLAIKRCGGIAMVQDPAEALYPEMPLSALEHIEADFCLPVANMGAVLSRLTQEPPQAMPHVPKDLLIEASIAAHPGHDHNQQLEALGPLVALSCPECGGPLRELRTEPLTRYRCRLGHAFTGESLLAGQSEAIEYALWAAVRTMEERIRILIVLASGRRERGQHKLAERYEERAQELTQHARQLRHILVEGPDSSSPGAS